MYLLCQHWYRRDPKHMRQSLALARQAFPGGGDRSPISLCAPEILPSQAYISEWGILFNGDCLQILPHLRDSSIDTVFADPPFNLSKNYGRKVNDDLPDREYFEWCMSWLAHCERVLKPGGALFVYNLPKWNILIGSYLAEKGMLFRHWIAVSIKLSLPIPGRLYPSHYSLLYFTKGKPKTFRRIRTPIQTCRHCGGEIRDYGGHRNAMNPKGVNLTDVWDDIPPVRHWKFKSKKRTANQLSTKILERVSQTSTCEEGVALDRVGGIGVTPESTSQDSQWLPETVMRKGRR
jgi:site-specific DNA-methyltransferase (adenine-specific)